MAGMMHNMRMQHVVMAQQRNWQPTPIHRNALNGLLSPKAILGVIDYA